MTVDKWLSKYGRRSRPLTKTAGLRQQENVTRQIQKRRPCRRLEAVASRHGFSCLYCSIACTVTSGSPPKARVKRRWSLRRGRKLEIAGKRRQKKPIRHYLRSPLRNPCYTNTAFATSSKGSAGHTLTTFAMSIMEHRRCFLMGGLINYYYSWLLNTTCRRFDPIKVSRNPCAWRRQKALNVPCTDTN